jgi:hypothetical protein
MPYYKKRKLAKFIKAVIDNEAETKRLIQTSQNFWTSDFQYTPISRDHAYATDGNLNYFCWQFKQNEPMFWPVDLHPLARGVEGGYEGDVYTAAGTASSLHTNQVRIGSEVRIKGISLDFMTWLKPQIPHLKIRVSLIRYARDDLPNKDNMFKNYTQNKMLDMTDNRRFKTLKVWNFNHYQSHPSTAGKEENDEGITGNDMNTDAYDGPQVAQHPTGLTKSEWFDYIEENHPGYQMASLDDIPAYWNLAEEWWKQSGVVHSLSTGFLKKRYDMVSGGHMFGVVKDAGHTGGTNSYLYDMVNDLAQNLSTSTILQQFSSTGTQTAQQVLLVKKVGAAPAEGQILVPIDKKHKLWIPGYMLGNGGTVHFKETNTNGYERDALYGHVLMFQTLSNYKTWEYTTGVTGSTATYLGRMTDFLQVTYFKDF